MKNVLILVANGSEAMELLVPVDILKRMGANIELASVEGMQIELQDGPKIVADKLFQDIKSFDNYDAIVLPGGTGHLVFKDSSKVKEVVEKFAINGKLVAAICASAGVIGDWGLLENKKATAYPGFGKAPNVEWTEELFEVDGNIITGKGPGGAVGFGFAIGNYLFDKDTVKNVVDTTFLKQ